MVNCTSPYFIVMRFIKQPVQQQFRTMQRTTHEKSIDSCFAKNPMAVLLFLTPSNLHCPALAQSLWVIFTFCPRFLLIFLKPLCIFPRWVGGLFVQRTLSCVYQRWRPLLCKCLFQWETICQMHYDLCIPPGRITPVKWSWIDYCRCSTFSSSFFPSQSTVPKRETLM